MPQQYVVNAFVDGPFTGNPAAVVVLDEAVDEGWMQAVAAQNNLSETAFVRSDLDPIGLRWFTPSQEIPLCGHATLATAHVIYEELADQRGSLEFATLSGVLTASRSGSGVSIDLPAVLDMTPADEAAAVLKALESTAGEVQLAGENPFVVFDAEADVAGVQPDFGLLGDLPGHHVVVSAVADDAETDVVCRVFAPKVGIPEDPVTGAAHTELAPFWSRRLGVDVLRSRQISARGGRVECRLQGDRVVLTGRCQTFLRGHIDP